MQQSATLKFNVVSLPCAGNVVKQALIQPEKIASKMSKIRRQLQFFFAQLQGESRHIIPHQFLDCSRNRKPEFWHAAVPKPEQVPFGPDCKTVIRVHILDCFVYQVTKTQAENYT